MRVLTWLTMACVVAGGCAETDTDDGTAPEDAFRGPVEFEL